jgi:peptidoglycan/xylan/chitin deacetylase (PgdA/CDA1 family)
MTLKPTASLSIDIEDWYHIPSVCGSTFSQYRDVDDFFQQWKERYDYLSEPAAKVLSILDDHHITATFFIVADVIDHYPGLVESIVDRGHEIACHGFHHGCAIDSKTKKALMSQEAFKDTTMKAKMALEKICGEKVVGYRAPNAMIAGWMIDSLEEMGFLYDSSISVNSLYNKTDSELKGVTTVPYCPIQHGLEPTPYRPFLEFPFSYYDIGLKIPTSGGPMLRFLGAHIMHRGIRQSLKRGHSGFYFHPIDISTEPFPRVGKGRPLYWMIKGEVVEKRIKFLLNRMSDVKWMTFGEYCNDRIVKRSMDDNDVRVSSSSSEIKVGGDIIGIQS